MHWKNGRTLEIALRFIGKVEWKWRGNITSKDIGGTDDKDTPNWGIIPGQKPYKYQPLCHSAWCRHVQKEVFEISLILQGLENGDGV